MEPSKTRVVLSSYEFFNPLASKIGWIIEELP